VVKPLKIEKCSFNIEENVTKHKTDLYEGTEDHELKGVPQPPQLILRRGFDFDLTFTFDRPYDSAKDSLTLILAFGNNPRLGRGTLINITVDKLKARQWSAEVTKTDGNTATVTIRSAPNAMVGRWTMRLDKIRKPEDLDGDGIMDTKEEVLSYEMNQPLYLLFNPWCKDDQVHMPDDDDKEIQKDEYVLNANGYVYRGTSRNIKGKPWNFDQFEDFMLPCLLDLLDRSSLSDHARGDPVKVSRALSALINSSDDDGVLMGNWSGDYSGGTKPTAWVGSGDIIREYYETGSPVKYGQCWVFSGVLCSACRCLGIPCRSVTTCDSAHDTDGSITIDYNYGVKEDGERETIDDMNSDSIWNFHVWNEVYMKVPEWGAFYNGWQAIDSTPQETSDGVYQAGPAPLTAIRKGEVNIGKDTPFIFAEVNADKVVWTYNYKTKKWTAKIHHDRVGHAISTKKPRLTTPKPEYPSAWRVDITDLYKAPAGSEEERAAVYRANQFSTQYPNLYENFGEEDVDFQIVMPNEQVTAGSNFDVILKIQNNSSKTRTVTHIKLAVTTSMYSGGNTKKVATYKGNNAFILGPAKSEEALLRVTAEQYQNLLGEQANFDVDAHAFVQETGQTFADNDAGFSLDIPDIDVKIVGTKTPNVVSPEESFDVKCTFKNPLNSTLTNCVWTVTGTGLESKPEHKSIKLGDIDPMGSKELTVTLKAKKKRGMNSVCVSLDTDELPDAKGECEFEIAGAPASSGGVSQGKTSYKL